MPKPSYERGALFTAYKKEEGEKPLKVEIKITPDEFRKMLPEELKKAFDAIVSNLIQCTALSEKEAKTLVAHEMLKALKEERC